MTKFLHPKASARRFILKFFTAGFVGIGTTLFATAVAETARTEPVAGILTFVPGQLIVISLVSVLAYFALGLFSAEERNLARIMFFSLVYVGMMIVAFLLAIAFLPLSIQPANPIVVWTVGGFIRFV